MENILGFRNKQEKLEKAFDVLLPKLFKWLKKKLLKFEAEGREFAKLLRSLEKFIQTVKGQNNFWEQNAFLTCPWRVLTFLRLEQIWIQIEKKIFGFRNMQ